MEEKSLEVTAKDIVKIKKQLKVLVNVYCDLNKDFEILNERLLELVENVKQFLPEEKRWNLEDEKKKQAEAPIEPL